MSEHDTLAFARLLLVHRGNRTRKQISIESGFNYQRVCRFEGVGDTVSLPSENEFLVLVKAYGLDEIEAKKALQESRLAKENRRKVLITLGKKPKKQTVDFSGSLASFADIKRYNGQAPNSRYGRS